MAQEGRDTKEAREAFEAGERIKNAAIPVPEQGDHAKSHAAHLETEGHVHTEPEGYGKQGREPGTVNEPPQDPKTSGKAFHRQ